MNHHHHISRVFSGLMSANKSLLYNNTGRQVLLYDIIGRRGDYYILLHVFVVKINQVFIA